MIILKLDWNKLHCCHDGCPHKATIVYINENLEQIYWEAHANIGGHSAKSIKFKSELSLNKSALNELEKKLVFVQKQMAYLRNENININSNSLIGK